MYRGELKAGDHALRFGDVTYLVGVINLSPESKNLHTVAPSPGEALSLARRYRSWGADLIEVGGQSSHYDNPTISERLEIERVAPAVEALVEDGFMVAVDTWKPAVAEAALAAGAVIINDTGGLASPEMRSVIASARAAAVAVHVDGDHPHAVGEVPISADPAGRVTQEFRRLISDLDDDLVSHLIVDPGIAINYRGDYRQYTRMQLEVIRSSRALAALDRPVLIPIPRKASIHRVTAYVALALEYGADLIRVHDVAVAADLVRLFDRSVTA